jgi:DNA-binding MarR family transcriptional regulator
MEARRTETKTRALVLALHHSALEEAGERIAAAQGDLEETYANLGPLIAGALGARMQISQIAQLTGISRQKVYELRDRQLGQTEDLEMRTLAQLGASGALTAAQIASQLGLSADQVTAATATLEAGGLIRVVMSGYRGGSTETYYKMSDEGANALERWMLGPEREPTRMCAYVAIAASEQEALRGVAIELFGPDWFAILEPGTVNGQTEPELAFHVVATGGEDAVARARERIEELRRLAGLAPRPAVISAMAPAGPLHLTYGRDRDWMVGGVERD